jgi:hypothetical protein
LSAHWADEAAKEKTINKHYSVSSFDKLYIDNTYGEVHVNTWDKNEITVEVHIKVKAKNEASTQGLLDDIDIEDSRSSNKIMVNTSINKRHITNENTEMNIDYTVNMPLKNGLDIANKFGAVYLDDFEGPLNLKLEYGKLKTKKLSGPEKDINVKFGGVDIASIEYGNLDISYSKLTIDKAEKIDVKNSFEKTFINSVKELKINQRYGDLNIGSVDEISGKVEFAGMDIDKVTKSAEINLQYSSKANFGSIGAGVDLLKIDAGFSSVSCKFENGASLSGDIDMSFGHFKNRSSNSSMSFEKEETSEYSNEERYTGKIGTGMGKMRIKAKYGDVVFK